MQVLLTLINMCPVAEAHFNRPQNVMNKTFTRSRENSVGLSQVEQHFTDRNSYHLFYIGLGASEINSFKLLYDHKRDFK